MEKSAEERERILEVLHDQTLFRHLDDEQRQFIVGAMFVKEYAQDDVIIQQGDDGDNFYIIDKGVVDCYRKTDDAEGSENKLVSENAEGWKEQRCLGCQRRHRKVHFAEPPRVHCTLTTTGLTHSRAV